MSRKINPIIYIIIGLAIFGLGAFLITNTYEFFKLILMTIGFVAILFAVLYMITNKKGSSGFSSKYKRAVKQSKQKYGSPNKRKQYANAAKAQQKQRSDYRNKPKRNATHLRVIEGKKDKKKDRALN